MDFVLACVMFGVFALGGVLVFQGIVGKELNFTPNGGSRWTPNIRAWSIHRNVTESDWFSLASA